jgi:hypothetical protein
VRSVVQLIVRLDIDGAVSPETLEAAHQDAEYSAIAAFRRAGALEVVALDGSMTQTLRKPGKRSKSQRQSLDRKEAAAEGESDE